jgi:hypothetical protein
MLCNQLAQVFFVTVKADYFDEGGSPSGGRIELG